MSAGLFWNGVGAASVELLIRLLTQLRFTISHTPDNLECV